MKEIEIRSLDLDISKAESDELEVQGIIATNSPSHILGSQNHRKWREIIVEGVFSKALEVAKAQGRDIDFLVDHNKDKILASTTNKSLKLEEDEYGLYIDAKISPTSWGKDLFVLVKDNLIKGLSFGMKVIQDEWTRTPDGLPLRTILEIELYEISALKVPAYPQTLLESRGLEVIDVEIPDDLEERSMGGYTVNENEITPQMFYDGMVLIAEKLDAIVGKFDEMQELKAVEGLQEAKEVLAKTQALVDAQTQTHAIDGAPTEETVEAKSEIGENKAPEDEQIDEKQEETKDLAPGEDQKDPNDLKEPNPDEVRSDEAKPSESDEKAPEGEKSAPEDKSEGAEKAPDEKSEETEEEKKKKQVNEYRSLLKTFKTEVPEIE